MQASKGGIFRRLLPKSHLYHYTGEEGFNGILQSGEIWLREYRSLKDKKEVDYLISLSKNVIKDSLESYASDEKNLLLELLDQYENQEIWPVYTVSLSVDPNNEHLWKKHGDNKKGFAIGFNREFHKPDEEIKDDEQNSFVVSNIIYKEKIAEQKLKKLLNLIIRMFHDERINNIFEKEKKLLLGNKLVDKNKMLFWFLFHHIITLAPIIKRPKFYPEKEHRLYYIENPLNPALRPPSNYREGIANNKKKIIKKTFGKGEIVEIIMVSLVM